MAMLLGTAQILVERRDYDGTVRFIFQPAEEHGRGSKQMMQGRLVERFPVDAIFGMHNMPGMRIVTLATRAGGIMASEDNFVICVNVEHLQRARTWELIR
jgi:metal-dependent amidase/aminoacylase/carboxypeptidase family protein